MRDYNFMFVRLSQKQRRSVILLKGNVCNLRPLRGEDEPILEKWLSDPELTIMSRGSMTAVSHPKEVLKKMMSSSPDSIWFAIDLISESTIVGAASIFGIDWYNRCARMGFIIGDEQYRGRGIGTDARHLVLRYVFDELNLNRIWGGYVITNAASRRFGEKAGAKVAGVLKSELFFHGKYWDIEPHVTSRESWLRSISAEMR